jgi:hypothetical protein
MPPDFRQALRDLDAVEDLTAVGGLCYGSCSAGRTWPRWQVVQLTRGL